MDENSETNEDGGTRTSSQKTAHLKWTNTLNFKELEKYENLSRPKHSLAVGSSEKDFFELFVTNDFYNKVAEETNKYAALWVRCRIPPPTFHSPPRVSLLSTSLRVAAVHLASPTLPSISPLANSICAISRSFQCVLFRAHFSVCYFALLLSCVPQSVLNQFSISFQLSCFCFCACLNQFFRASAFVCASISFQSVIWCRI